MQVVVHRPLPAVIERARLARDDAEVLRDTALSIAYRSACVREDARALRAEAAQARRRARQTSDVAR